MMDQPFGNPSTYEGHSGVDYGQPTGALIKASGEGTVTGVGYWNDRAGYATVVDYENGPRVLYCHQPQNARRPSFGDRVAYGHNIGEVGSTGFSTGPHLHMEILEGEGAGTYAGVWNYFDRNRVVGDGSSTGNNDKPATKIKMIRSSKLDSIIKATSDSGDGVVTSGQTFAYTAGAPLTLMSAEEVSIFEFSAGKGSIKPEATIQYRSQLFDGPRLRTLMRKTGYYGWTDGNGATKYGEILY